MPTSTARRSSISHPTRSSRMAPTDGRAAAAMRPIFPASNGDRFSIPMQPERDVHCFVGACPVRGTRDQFSGTCAGFTLLEMVAVMLIVALVAGLVVTLTPGSGRAQLKSTALDTAALLRRERQGAVLT